MHILFVTATRIGDAVLSTGLLSYLIERHPGRAADRLPRGRSPRRCSKRCLGSNGWSSSRSGAGPCIGCRFMRAVATRRWDLVVDLRGSALAWLLRAGERRVMAKGDPREHRVRQLGAAVRSRSAAEPAPVDGAAPRPGRRRADPAGRPGVGDRPGGELARQAMAGGALCRAGAAADRSRTGRCPAARVAVLAAAHERGAGRAAARGDPGAAAIDLVGRLDLLTAAAVLRRCAMFIGNDTGLMHIAAASGTPTLGLFGPSPVEQYAPWGRCTAVVRTARTARGDVPARLRPPHHRYADGRLVGRCGRSGGAPAVASRRERGGMSAAANVATPAAAAAAGRACRPWLSPITRRRSSRMPRRASVSPTRSSSCSTAAPTVRARSRCDSPTASSKARGRAKGRGATPGSRPAAANGSWRSTPTSGSARSWPPKSAPWSRSSSAAWHLIPVDNYIGERLVRWGWGASFGKSAYAGLFRKGVKAWGDERVLHPSVTLTGQQGPSARRAARPPCRPQHLRHAAAGSTATPPRGRRICGDSGDIGSYGHNLRRIFSRFWKCYVGRRGYREGALRFSDRALRRALPDPFLSQGAARAGLMARGGDGR